MQNGTEKQIAWATEMKTLLIDQVKNNPNALHSDREMLAAVSVINSHGTREMDRDSRVALKNERRSKFSVMTPDDLRALAIAEMGKIEDAQWWIDNRSEDRAVLAIIKTL